MTDETTLLPCPFCGSKANIEYGEFGDDMPALHRGHARVSCTHAACGASFSELKSSEAIAINSVVRKWNRRHTEDDLK